MTTNARAIVATLSLVLFGAVVGVATDRLWLAHRRPTIVIDASHAQRFHALLDTLGLSDEQRRAMDSVLAHFQQNVELSWQALQPDLTATIDSATQQIEAILTPEQRATFRAWRHAEHQLQHDVHRGLHR